MEVIRHFIHVTVTRQSRIVVLSWRYQQNATRDSITSCKVSKKKKNSVCVGDFVKKHEESRRHDNLCVQLTANWDHFARRVKVSIRSRLFSEKSSKRKWCIHNVCVSSAQTLWMQSQYYVKTTKVSKCKIFYSYSTSIDLLESFSATNMWNLCTACLIAISVISSISFKTLIINWEHFILTYLQKWG